MENVLIKKKSWKIQKKKISKVIQKEKLYPNLGSIHSHRYGSFQIVEIRISFEKFERIPTGEMVIENR